jgi:hypothetical protein
MSKRRESSLTQRAMEALTTAVAKVVAEHRRSGRPLAVWRNGEAVWLHPESIRSLNEMPVSYTVKRS